MTNISPSSRVTKFKINWDDSSAAANGESSSANDNGIDANGIEAAASDEENRPPPPPPNPYLPEHLERPNPLPLQKDPMLVRLFDLSQFRDESINVAFEIIFVAALGILVILVSGFSFKGQCSKAHRRQQLLSIGYNGF